MSEMSEVLRVMIRARRELADGVRAGAAQWDGRWKMGKGYLLARRLSEGRAIRVRGEDGRMMTDRDGQPVEFERERGQGVSTREREGRGCAGCLRGCDWCGRASTREGGGRGGEGRRRSGEGGVGMDRKGFFLFAGAGRGPGAQPARALVCTCPARSNFFPFPKLPLCGNFCPRA